MRRATLEKLKELSGFSSSEDEAEFPCNIPAGSEVDCVNVEQCGATALGGMPGFCYNFR